jgi:hypothetical protein
MQHTRLTPAQRDETESGNRALLTLSRERHAAFVATQASDHANVTHFGQSQIDQAKTLLARAHGKQLQRRFSGESITGFGGLL